MSSVNLQMEAMSAYSQSSHPLARVQAQRGEPRCNPVGLGVHRGERDVTAVGEADGGRVTERLRGSTKSSDDGSCRGHPLLPVCCEFQFRGSPPVRLTGR